MLQRIKQSAKSLLQHRLRSFLSTLGVLFGVAAIIAMLSIGEGAKQETLEQISELGMNSILIRQHHLSEEQRAIATEQKSFGLSLEDVEALRNNVPGLVKISPLKEIKATITGSSNQLSPEILSVTHVFGEAKGLQLKEGRFICDLDQVQRKHVCVIGESIAKLLGNQGRVGGMLRLKSAHYEIIGVLQPTHRKLSKHHHIAMRNLDQAVFIPLESTFSHEDSLAEITLYIENLKGMDNAALMTKKILGKLHGGYEDYQVIIPQELLMQAAQTQRTFNLVLGGIATLSLLVGGVGIMNIMLATVSERTREIGIRRAVGASQKDILHQFLLETFLLTISGAVLGVFIGIILSEAIALLAGWKTIITFWSIFIALFMASVVGGVSGFYPAYQAAKMNPIQALN